MTLALGALASACVGGANPVTGERDWTLVDEQEELRIGHETHQQIIAYYGVYDDPELQEYVSRVGHDLVPHTHRPELTYRFTVLDSPVINAFATPGYVYISRGMLAMLDSEAELAGILGHELAHITARHTARQIGQRQTVDIIGLVVEAAIGAGSAVNSAVDFLGEAHVRGYGRDNELEADRLGARYAALAGYDPEALIEVLRILKDQELYEVRRARREGRQPQAYHGLFATHPDSDDRLQQVISEARQHRGDSEPLVRREEYLRRIDGMTVGLAEAEGALRRRHFYHRDFDFAVTLPEGWNSWNQREQLLAVAPGQDVWLSLALLVRQPGLSACDAIRRKFEERTSRLRERATAGFSGCQALVQARGAASSVVLVLERSPQVFIVAGAGSKQSAGLRRYGQVVEETFQSIRPLTKAEYAAAEPVRLKIVEAKAGDTYAGYAEGADWDPHPVEQLRLMNAAYPAGEPTPGERVKTVQ